MKKHLYLLLSLLLVLSFSLSGCGGTPANTPASTETAGTTSTEPTVAAATETAAPETIDPLGKYPETITISYGRLVQAEQTFLEGESYDNNVWIKEFESELGIKVVPAWEAQGADDYDTKLNLDIISGTLPDFFHITTVAQLQKLVDGGLVEDLTEVSAKWRSPLVKGYMDLGGGVAEEQCSINGKLYAYPTGAVAPGGEQFVYIREDLRKELGLPEPKTMEDLMAYAKAVVDNKKVDFAFALSNTPFETYMSMVGFFNAFDAFPRTWIERDGKIVYGAVQPEMKTALAAIRQAYDEGLISKEFALKGAGDAAQDMVDGSAAICFGQFWMNGWPLDDGWARNKFDTRGYAIPHISTATMKKVQGTAVAITRGASVYCVRKGYEHPEAVAKMNNYFTEKGYGATADNKKYRIDGDVNIFTISPVQGAGKPYINNEIAKTVTAAIDNNDPSLVAGDAQKTGAYESVKKFLDGTGTEKSNYNDWKFFYGPTSIFAIEDNYIANGQIMTNAFYGAETPEMIRRMSVLNDMEIQMILEILSGSKPVDAFDTFVADWYKQGGELITAEVNEWKKDNGK